MQLIVIFLDNDAQMQVTKFFWKRSFHLGCGQNLCSLSRWKFIVFKILVGFGFYCSDCNVSRIIYGRCTATCAEYIMLDPFSLQQMDRSGIMWIDIRANICWVSILCTKTVDWIKRLLIVVLGYWIALVSGLVFMSGFSELCSILCNQVAQSAEGQVQFDAILTGLLRRILDSNKRVQEAACSAFATLEEVLASLCLHFIIRL